MTDATTQSIENLTSGLESINHRLLAVESEIDKIAIFERSQVEEPVGPNELFTALAAAQAELQDPTKDSTANAGQYSYKYATLASTLSAVRPVLAKHGLSLIQLPGRKMDNDVELLTLTTILGHSSGQSIENYFEMYPPKRDPQGIGSAMTYMRRYVVMAIVGIAGADDDDAEKAQPTVDKISAAQADSIFNLADDLLEAQKEYLPQFA